MQRLLLTKRARKRYEDASARVGRVCVRAGLTADALTAASIGLAALAAWLLAGDRLLWALGAGVASSVLDMLDGATARAAGTTSRFGTVLDRTADRANECLFLLGILLGGRVAPAVVLVTLFALVLPSYVRALGESAGGLRDCEVGLAGRLEKLALMGAGLLLEVAIPQARPLQWSMVAASALAIATAIQRLLHVRVRARAAAAGTGEAAPREGGTERASENAAP